jgi:hypothetical protein
VVVDKEADNFIHPRGTSVEIQCRRDPSDVLSDRSAMSTVEASASRAIAGHCLNLKSYRR